MTSVEISLSQQPHLDKLHKMTSAINAEVSVPIDATNGEEIAYRLTRRIELLQYTPGIMELATVIYDHCKGLCAEEVMNDERLLNLKADVQRKWFDGRLAKWNGLYALAERTCKDLNSGIDGLRSVLSREKELMKNNNI
jgi:hypothetical protein